MKMLITLIRSGLTEANREGRYTGHMDDALDPEGIRRIERRKERGDYPQVSRVYTSEQLRSRDTASLIYPRIPAIVVGDLRAYSYGTYEGKRYHEMLRDSSFLNWADSEEVLAYPDGESPHVFFARCNKSFLGITRELCDHEIKTAAIITHNSVIYTILQRYCAPRSRYLIKHFDYGGGCTILFDSDLNAGILQKNF